ncbi:hypothetical protein AB0C02_28035 [Micromonospora sp. NPDC048999]|uniref:hypothetical protein n=1 Tax=Micromonospora sp. NPDC048999 TaxID=3155391 RepID=UPI0034021F55
MTRIHNGPARNTPKGTARLTRADVAATVPAHLTRCCCAPVTVGVFHGQQLVDVERRHMRAQGCQQPTGHTDPQVYQADIRTGRR